MSRTARIIALAIAAAGLTACSDPMSPTIRCNPLKDSSCTSVNFVNPNVNFVNPNVNFVNPNVNFVNPNVNRLSPEA
ncbi:MAG: hypothetical protein ACT4OZ_11580 [Gemmatimonadota bacterium]